MSTTAEIERIVRGLPKVSLHCHLIGTVAPQTVVELAAKHGVPLDADFVFDVRAVPNPYYDLSLRPLNGRDAPVIAFLEAQPQAIELLSDIRAFVAKWLPSFKKDNRSYLTVAVGCTGGKHRSVACSEAIEQRLRTLGHSVRVMHRDIGRD